jgi:hypothetical protein
MQAVSGAVCVMPDELRPAPPASSPATHWRFRPSFLIWNDDFTSLSIWNIHSIAKCVMVKAGCLVVGGRCGGLRVSGPPLHLTASRPIFFAQFPTGISGQESLTLFLELLRASRRGAKARIRCRRSRRPRSWSCAPTPSRRSARRSRGPCRRWSSRPRR